MLFNEWVDLLYTTYPRHVAKQDAMKAIRKRLLDLLDSGHSDPYGYLMGRVKLFAEGRRKFIEQGEDPKYTPHASTWFNQTRDLDDEQWWFPPEVVRVL